MAKLFNIEDCTIYIYWLGSDRFIEVIYKHICYIVMKYVEFHSEYTV